MARALLRRVREPAKSIVYTETKRSTLDLRCYVVTSYNQATESGVRFNARGSICGLMCRNDRFSPVQWKTAEIKRRISSVKAELFALDYASHSSFLPYNLMMELMRSLSLLFGNFDIDKHKFSWRF